MTTIEERLEQERMVHSAEELSVVPCRRCGALIGRPCLNRWGEPTHLFFHYARHVAAANKERLLGRSQPGKEHQA